MRKLLTIASILLSVLGQAQIQYQPEEMKVLNRFAIPYRDTISSPIKIGDTRLRPQDKQPYWWTGEQWITFPTTTGGGDQDLSSVLGYGNSSTNSIDLTGYKTATFNLNAGKIALQSYSADNHILGFSTYYNGSGFVRAETGTPWFINSAGSLSIHTAASGSSGTTYTPIKRFEIETDGEVVFPAYGDGSSTRALSVDANGKLVAGGGSSQWTTVNSNNISYTGATTHSIVTAASPVTGAAALFQAKSFDNVDVRLQAGDSYSYIGTVTNHPLWLVANNTNRIEMPAAGGVRFPELAGNGAGVIAVDNDGDISWSAGGGGGSGPAGSTNQIQVNGGGVFSASANLTYDGNYFVGNGFKIGGLPSASGYYAIFANGVTPSATNFNIATDNSGGELYLHGNSAIAIYGAPIQINDGSNSLTLPTTRPGTNGYVPSWNTDGTFNSWVAAGGGGGSSQWTTNTTNTISYTGADNHSGVSVLSPATTKAAYFRAASFDGVDVRMQSGASDAFIGTVTNHPFYLYANSVLGIGINTSGVVRFNDAYSFPTSIGSVGQALRVPASGTTLEWFTPSGGGSYTASQSITLTGSNFTLTNDNASPGASKYYGTNSSGTKGFHDFPATGDAGFVTLAGVTNGITPLQLTGGMTVSSGEAGNFEITVYAINSSSNSSYHHKIIIPYLATSSTTISFGTETSQFAPEAIGSALSSLDGVDSWDYGYDGNGDLTITVVGVSGQNIQWRVEIKKYTVTWSS